MHTNEPRHRDNGGEMRVSKRSSLPWSGTVVGFTDEANVSVRPALAPQPRHRCINAPLFIGTHQIHTVIRFASSKHGDLSNAVAVRNIVLNQHSAKPICRGESVDIPIVVVRTNFSNHGDLARLRNIACFPIASFDHWQPETEMNFCVSCQASATICCSDCGNGYEHRANRVDSVRAVHRDTSKDI